MSKPKIDKVDEWSEGDCQFVKRFRHILFRFRVHGAFIVVDQDIFACVVIQRAVEFALAVWLSVLNARTTVAMLRIRLLTS